MTWDQEKIKSVLPHREPFLFIDEIIEIDGTQKLVAVKNIKKDESYFKGHFPGKPIMPGALIIEVMAQASIILFSLDRPQIASKQPDYYLGKVKAEFLSPVYPGDQLMVEINKIKFSDFAGITDAVSRVNKKITAKASLVFGLKINER